MNINVSYDNAEKGKGYYIDFVTGKETSCGTLETINVGFCKIRIIALIIAKLMSYKKKCYLNIC